MTSFQKARRIFLLWLNLNWILSKRNENGPVRVGARVARLQSGEVQANNIYTKLVSLYGIIFLENIYFHLFYNFKVVWVSTSDIFRNKLQWISPQLNFHTNWIWTGIFLDLLLGHWELQTLNDELMENSRNI